MQETGATWKKYLRKETLPLPFCPGCGHGILLSAILRSIGASGIDIKDIVFFSGIGCAGWIPSPHIKADTMHVTHGRPIAFATGAKLFNPRLKVVVVSGDGDLASIGGNHLIHAARRDIEMMVVCANNEIYGMTGGQVSPTTSLGVKTTTTLKGNIEPPLDLCRLVEAAGASYVARSTVFHLEHLISVLQKALRHRGFSFIDALSPCPVQYGRRNLYATAAEQLKDLEKRSISIEKAHTLPSEAVRDKIIIGEFVSRHED